MKAHMMKYLKTISILIVATIMTLWTLRAPPIWASETSEEIEKLWNFENVASDQIPKGWVIEGTNQVGRLATWRVIEDASAPSGKKVMGMLSANHSSDDTFNLCWTEFVSLRNGVIEVRFKADTGEVDQGGGIIWRVQDKDNYYISRYNPLEENFRIYHARDGLRTRIASARIRLPAGIWHTLKITHFDDSITGYLNGHKLLEVKDRTFKESGGIGLWTKADAVTLFDNLLFKGY